MCVGQDDAICVSATAALRAAGHKVVRSGNEHVLMSKLSDKLANVIPSASSSEGVTSPNCYGGDILEIVVWRKKFPAYWARCSHNF